MIKEAIATLQKQNSKAIIMKNWPLPLAAFEPWVLHVFKDLYPTLDKYGLYIFGVPQIGKTPLMRSILTRRSFDEGSNSIVLSSEIDFFRQQKASVKRPAGYDDGDVQTLTPKIFKALTEVSSEDRSAWARWGGCRWEKGQTTGIVDNKVNLKAEKGGEPSGVPDTITNEEFQQLIAPIWHKDFTPSDEMAVLKRGHFIAPTRKFLYIRKAVEGEVPVERLRVDGKVDWIKDS